MLHAQQACCPPTAKKSNAKITNSLGLLSSSLLEVELHDGKTEQEREKHGQPNVHHCDNPQEVMTEAEVILDKLRHGLACHRVIERMRDVTKLGGNQSVECPCDWAGPAVPPPPDRQFLKEKNECIMSNKKMVKGCRLYVIIRNEKGKMQNQEESYLQVGGLDILRRGSKCCRMPMR